MKSREERSREIAASAVGKHANIRIDRNTRVVGVIKSAEFVGYRHRGLTSVACFAIELDNGHKFTVTSLPRE